jgi:pimeloyl-ACP methyl ester carboxylesterase
VTEDCQFLRLATFHFVLAIGGEKSLGEFLGKQTKDVASDVTVVVLKDAGHWVMEERPKETMDALLKFLGQ